MPNRVRFIMSSLVVPGLPVTYQYEHTKGKELREGFRAWRS
jgi:hypothetical protein